MTEQTTRRAKLEVRRTHSAEDLPPYFVAFDASNGEPLGNGETHPTKAGGVESRRAWIRAMIEVLEDEGYKVSPPASGLVDPQETFVDPGAER